MRAVASPVAVAFTVGGALAAANGGGGSNVAAAVAGAASVNTADQAVEAFASGSAIGSQAFTASAQNDATLVAIAGAVSFAWAASTSATSVSVGVSVASNQVGQGAATPSAPTSTTPRSPPAS